MSATTARGLAGLALAAVLAAVSVPGAMATEKQPPQSRGEMALSFAPVVKRTAPAVVNIYTKKVVVRQAVSPMMNDPFFRRFFGDEFAGRMGMPQKRIQNSLGSGVIVRADGIILTNNHVIKDADQITVVLSDRREAEAKVVGVDERTDLAVLKLVEPLGNLPVLEFSDSDQLEVGDLVLAIGNPFGVGQTVTSGIVSALARTSVGISDFRSFIQTDAAINPGNSGGALVTAEGKLAGINTAIYSRDGGNVGIGFAIPANMVRTTLNGILETGKAVHPWLGASGQPVDQEVAASLGLDRPGGVLINHVVAGSPAARAGLQSGDVILSFNGKDLSDVQALRYLVASSESGRPARLGVLREGRLRDVEIVMVQAPENPSRDVTEVDGRTPLTGTRLANLNPALAEELGMDYQGPQVVLMAVNRNGFAAQLGFEPGDILVAINGTKVGSVKEAIGLLQGPPRSQWLVSVIRDGQVMNIRVG
ncbi:DegQ family serine endoprotease [Novispirillum itersonii]|uniref:Serine protease Do n=1 Tax=Novispirillum itersonii TaxID=189 RepID=A0A7X0DKG3_NOVIT|nr:DegQ family serine endoprotease [Novispirillum itersonii]MBB6208923.1 serine protease Do [Novispirillum itersonii]